MLDFAYGNILEAPVVAVVKVVSTKGVTGKGLVLQFRKVLLKGRKSTNKLPYVRTATWQ